MLNNLELYNNPKMLDVLDIYDQLLFQNRPVNHWVEFLELYKSQPSSLYQ